MCDRASARADIDYARGAFAFLEKRPKGFEHQSSTDCVGLKANYHLLGECEVWEAANAGVVNEGV